ncbi:molybdate ABC transporter permease subunit [Ureibacillus sinduriensis]|uniref:Molybdenum transport system permease n=1 Tax=Ureibacillus sinduriensis BLB-1 = JCM 15800 TaxID=1384057 RepID=A0A0A3I4Z8_9BACL|nr:molybdate ABC transporter permease subunit [Ureibacillus sinduriensis]KGR78605.1 molybdenum ABC transporter permease [Ureibacillus sinduriensis BLB-1 = JCM 15800]
MWNEFWEPIQLSITVTIAASAIVLLAGTTLGFVFARKTFKFKLLLETLFMLPLVLPPSVIGFLLVVIFGNQSPIGIGLKSIFGQSIIFTWYAAVISASVVAFPLMFQTAKAGFQGIHRGIEEAAIDLGANSRQVFIRVSLPLAKKSIVAGGVLSSARALGEFGATLMFAGNIPGITQTVPTAIYMAIDSGDMFLAWAWVITMMLLAFFLLYFVRSKEKGRN